MTEQAFNKLEELIVTLQLKPGQIVTENELSNMIGIGRTPVREAVKMLNNASLVKVIPHRGIIISELNLEEMFLQIEVRRVLEGLIAERAAKFSTAQERGRFLQLRDAFQKAITEDDAVEVIKVDTEFHALISEAARNVYASKAVVLLQSLAKRYYFSRYQSDDELIQRINISHMDLMEAVASGDVAKSKQVSDELIDQIQKLYSHSFKEHLGYSA